MVLGVITMFVSGLVENRRRNLAFDKPILGFVVEFFYKEFPENMRSFGGSFLFCGFAMSNYLSSFLISIVHRMTKVGERGNWLDEDLNKGRLDYFYYMVAGLEVVNLVYFVVCAKWYKYKRTEKSGMDLELEKIETQKNVV
ncbi:hypothetical protein RD792_000479 [Penstemon davidsonii]|uniref:Uncharacterized protein n=1 Tax=Penstemon davidsonii TaxID=160366 RepID=A0ABR0DLI2_9LAMI|nr:hypothetical protein RD792_000479 [Penstemon davidsonii]